MRYLTHYTHIPTISFTPKITISFTTLIRSIHLDIQTSCRLTCFISLQIFGLSTRRQNLQDFHVKVEKIKTSVHFKKCVQVEEAGGWCTCWLTGVWEILKSAIEIMRINRPTIYSGSNVTEMITLKWICIRCQIR